MIAFEIAHEGFFSPLSVIIHWSRCDLIASFALIIIINDDFDFFLYWIRAAASCEEQTWIHSKNKIYWFRHLKFYRWAITWKIESNSFQFHFKAIHISCWDPCTITHNFKHSVSCKGTHSTSSSLCFFYLTIDEQRIAVVR